MQANTQPLKKAPEVARRWLPWFAGIFIFLLPLALWPRAKSEDLAAWQSTGNTLGALNKITIANDEGLTTLYRWGVSGLHRSVDESRSWTSVGAGLPENVAGGLRLLALQPGQTRTLYALAGEFTQRVLYKSIDAGTTFEPFYRPVDFTPELLSVAAAETGDTILLAGGDQLVISRDSGASWNTVQMPGTATTLAAGATLWVGGEDWLANHSSDSENWQFRTLPDGIIPQQILSPGRGPSQLYLRHSSGLLRSANGGLTWKEVVLPESQTISAIAFDPVVWQTLYAGDKTGSIWRSDDWGEHWQIHPGPTAGSVDALFVARNDRGRLYIVSGFDLWWTTQTPLQPTPTATPSATPSPTATSTITPSPSPTSTPTPQPATDTPQPTATATPRPPSQRGAAQALPNTPTPTFTPSPLPPDPTRPDNTPAPPTPIPTPTMYR